MNYLVIDLEMCNVPKMSRKNGFNCRNEIIQIGTVLLDEEYKEIGRLSQYVRPQYGSIDKFIERLTGIKPGNVKHAPDLKEALEHLLDWIGDREIEVIAWSGSDLTQLRRELAAKEISNQNIEDFLKQEKWKDYQLVFDRRFENSNATSLEQALILCDIQTEGRMHDGLFDAVNTASLIRFLEENREFRIRDVWSEYMSDEPCSFTLESIFSGLGLVC